MPLLELKTVSFAYGESLVVNDVDLSIEDEQILSVMGPSGCGKSTVLRLLSGLETPSSGQCLFKNRIIDRPSSELRFSFQNFDAFPWRTVRQNLLLGGAAVDGDRDAFNVNDLLKKIGLAGHENKYPAELSGGMRKRLALGRCLAGKPRAILLDEPFSSLDVDARHQMYTLLQNLWQEWKCLIIVVTHDIHEAILLSRQVIVSEPIPFRKKDVVQVPFDYPRDDSIMDSPEYLMLAARIRRLF